MLMGRKEGGLVERYWVEQWLEAESQSFNTPSSTLVLQLALAPRMGLKQDPALIEQSEGKLAKVLDVYEQRLGERGSWLGMSSSLLTCHTCRIHITL